MPTLFVLGNGFDLNHGLPTKYDPDLKILALKAERYAGEWESYSIEGDLWSAVEEGLAHPDIESVIQYLEQFAPDYSSERETDRDGVVFEAEQLLAFPLNEFAERADAQLHSTEPSPSFVRLFCPNDSFLTFNYTHTLEHLYNVDSSRVLHVHGEVGESPLILGYSPKSLSGTQILHQWDEEENFDFYVSSAHQIVEERLRSFEKVYQTAAVHDFIRRFQEPPNRIVVYGHSFGTVDRPYFALLLEHFSEARWTILGHSMNSLDDACGAFDDYGFAVQYDAEVY